MSDDAQTPTDQQQPADGQQQTHPAQDQQQLPDWTRDPAAAERMVREARQEAAAARTAGRDAARSEAATEARTALLRELGLVQGDETPDPAQLAQDLQSARTAATDSARELAIYRNAPAGTDVTALLDSRSFLTTVATIDPTDTAALVAAIGTATSSNPRLKTGQAPASSGTDLPGGQQAAPSFTRAQLRDQAFYEANKPAILAALRDGRIS